MSVEFVEEIAAKESSGYRSPIPLVVDTDMGSDDWLAILYLLKSKSARVRGVTVAEAGLSHSLAGAQHLLDMALHAGKRDLAVAIGPDKPLAGNREFPSHWRARADRFLDISLPRSDATPLTQSAVDFLFDLVEREGDPVTVVALAPLTNLAEALRRDHRILARTKGVVVMGGVLNGQGNAPDSRSEWNIYIDPLAASIVLSSEANITLVPLDATNQVPVTIGFYRRLKRERDTPAAKLAFRILDKEFEEIEAGEYYFWDSLAAAVALDESLAQFERLPVVVAADPEKASYGQTLLLANHEATLRVCTGVDRDAFEDRLIGVLNED
jgi:pyrimidine-specific ribonucleoside hydrolase